MVNNPLGHSQPILRIGELARRTGVAPTTLRVWQRRYGVPAPSRTTSGYRLYSVADVELVQRLQRLVDDGVAIGEAVRIVSNGSGWDPAAASEDHSQVDMSRLLVSILSFNGTEANEELDRLFAEFPTSTVLTEGLLPLLQDIGEGYTREEVSIGQEHFASNLIRARLWGLVRNWDRGGGRRAVLASAPGDQHELGLLMFGLALRELGWRITYLGADTPASEVGAVLQSTGARTAVIGFGRHLEQAAQDLEDLRSLAADSEVTVAIGGWGATQELADSIGAVLLNSDPVTAAHHACFSTP